MVITWRWLILLTSHASFLWLSAFEEHHAGKVSASVSSATDLISFCISAHTSTKYNYASDQIKLGESWNNKVSPPCKHSLLTEMLRLNRRRHSSLSPRLFAWLSVNKTGRRRPVWSFFTSFLFCLSSPWLQEEEGKKHKQNNTITLVWWVPDCHLIRRVHAFT